MYWKELTTGIYAWDIHDEGIETILDNLQKEAGCNAAYLIALMHHEKRPLHDHYYHHNPVRKYYIAEDSRAYWTIHPERYRDSRIKPLPSERDFLRGKDWLEVFVAALRKRGMRPGAEISHTPLDKARAREEFADCIQRDIYGNPLALSGWHAGQQLCWNSPDARAYVCALATDLVTHYDIDMLQTCTYLFNGGRGGHPLAVTTGGCFCAHCETAARESGLDWDAIRRTVRRFADAVTGATVEAHEEWLLIQRGDSTMTMFLLEHPELYAWMRFRCDSIARFFRELSDTIHAANPKVEFRYNTCWKDSENIGLDLTAVGPYIDALRIMDYSEQTGDEERVLGKGRWLTNCRRQLGDDKKIVAAVAPRAKATPELIRKGIRTVALHGADALSFGFYDGATMERLRAIRQGMEEAEVRLIGAEGGD